MEWQSELTTRLAKMEEWGYVPNGPGFTEPTALACLALQALGQSGDAIRAAEQLRASQVEAGSIGLYPGMRQPTWPTGWALLAWQRLEGEAGDDFRQSMERGARWLLGLRGEVLEPSPILGHDVTLCGWPWVQGTHSWVEPTAIAILGLRAIGYGTHPRVREAVRLLLDRQLPGGGCNYGNTLVLNQTLLPHAQPTGLALMALAEPRLRKEAAVLKSTALLRRQWSTLTGVSSICYAALGLAAQGEPPPGLESMCQALYERVVVENGDSGYALALIALATLAVASFVKRADNRVQVP